MALYPRKIRRITEKDFDEVIFSAGGVKIDTGRDAEGVMSADYKLGPNVLELKLIEEEGLNKIDRQSKIADIFNEQFPDYPVIVIDPYLIASDERRQKLYRILETPIKSHVKKASKQLKSSSEKHNATGRVLVIINNGYMSLRHEDFERLVLKCVRNDTSSIDLVIIGGLYYECDGFESYVFGHFRPFSINLSKRVDIETLDAEWDKLLMRIMNDLILSEDPDSAARCPNSDLAFEHKGKTFVRPRAQVGNPSSFYINGRPRKNSTGIVTCPPVAIAMPEVAEGDWRFLREFVINGNLLPDNYRDWRDGQLSKREPEDPIMPIVFFRTSTPNFVEFAKSPDDRTLERFFEFTAICFSNACESLCKDAIELPSEILIGGKFILVRTIEIGSDKLYDFSSIHLISNIPGMEREEVIVENARIFFEHAIGLGASYAIRYGCSRVFWEKNTEFGWV
jgi:hypothetical protein